MSLQFEELDYRDTPIGALSLRRRRELSLGIDVFEIKLGDEYLMSSLFTASEVALANLQHNQSVGILILIFVRRESDRCSSGDNFVHETPPYQRSYAWAYEDALSWPSFVTYKKWRKMGSVVQLIRKH